MYTSWSCFQRCMQYYGNDSRIGLCNIFLACIKKDEVICNSNYSFFQKVKDAAVCRCDTELCNVSEGLHPAFHLIWILLGSISLLIWRFVKWRLIEAGHSQFFSPVSGCISIHHVLTLYNHAYFRDIMSNNKNLSK